MWEILKEMGISDHLTCLLRNLYAGQEATELDMEQQTGSKLGRSMTRLYIVSLLILLLCRVHHVKCQDWTTHKLESRLPWRNSNNLRYADDTILNSLLRRQRVE